MPIVHEHANVQAAGEIIAQHLTDLERVVGPNYTLSFVAQCTNPDIPDADIVVTAGRLGDLLDVVRRRLHADYGLKRVCNLCGENNVDQLLWVGLNGKITDSADDVVAAAGITGYRCRDCNEECVAVEE